MSVLLVISREDGRETITSHPSIAVAEAALVAFCRRDLGSPPPGVYETDGDAVYLWEEFNDADCRIVGSDDRSVLA